MEKDQHIDLTKLLFSDLGLDPMALKGQVVVVTGAGRGIGLQTARAFALLGAQVGIAELSDQGKDTEEVIREEGGEALFIRTDVSDPDSVLALTQQIRESLGPVSILVNNAIFITEAGVSDMRLEDWDQTFAVNLRGAFLTCRAFLPEMLKQDQALILNMVSTDAMPGLSAYIASKQGLTGFSQSLALEVHGSGLRVIPFAPGMVDTPGIRNISEGLAPRLGLTEDQFLNLSLHAAYEGLMPPEHAAAATVYLALKLADEYHGEVVTGYEVLEKAGFLKTAGVDLRQSNGDGPSLPTSQRDLLRELSQILKETEKEFQQLPIFVRPIAKQGFRRKAEASLSDWQELISALASGKKTYPADFAHKLKQLSQYFFETPQETARFTRDEETLRQVTHESQRRVAVIQKITEKL